MDDSTSISLSVDGGYLFDNELGTVEELFFLPKQKFIFFRMFFPSCLVGIYT